MQKTFHIIGAGKVGHTLALLLQQQGWQLAAVVSRSGRALWADHCGGRIVPCIADLPRADVLIISTPDDAIAAAAQEAAALPWLHGGVLALHLSGAKSAAALDALAARGVRTGSLHPGFAFADVAAAVRTRPGRLCALEAPDAAALAGLREVAAALGLRAFEMPSEQKARYHAALSAASNFSVALAAYAQNLLQPLALPEALSRELVVNLMRQSVDNVAAMPPAAALTGPIVRGDEGTVAAHLAALSAAEREAYGAWARQTLVLAAARLDEGVYARVEKVLACGEVAQD